MIIDPYRYAGGGGDITTGLIGYWTLDDNSGTAPANTGSASSGSAFITVNPTWVAPGKIGASMLNFGGAGGVSLSYAAAGLSTPACTMSALIRFSSTPNGYNAVLSIVDGSGGYRQMFVKSNGTLAFYFNGSGNISYDGTGATLSSNTWYRITVTYDSTAGLIGYINTTVDGTAGANGALKSVAGDGWTLGYDANTAGRYFNGDIDDVRIYDRALTALDVATLPT